MGSSSAAKWVMLTHQIPSQPSAFRVKIWRRLQDIGAVSVRKAVYLLPNRPACAEDLQWLRQQILDAGGTATVFTADAVERVQHQEIVSAFQLTRDGDYIAILEQFSRLESAGGSASDRDAVDELAHLREQLEAIVAIDFFEAPSRSEAQAACRRCEALLQAPDSPRRTPVVADPSVYHKRRWVTRKGMHIDRVSSSWLIKRYIDPEARFAFVEEGTRLRKQDVPFDMFGVDFGHHDDNCTFEILLQSFDLKDAALQDIARIVHDADLKDGKYGRGDVEGIEKAIRALGSQMADARLLEVGLLLFDGLYKVLNQDG